MGSGRGRQEEAEEVLSPSQSAADRRTEGGHLPQPASLYQLQPRTHLGKMLLHIVSCFLGLVAIAGGASHDIRGDIVMLGHIVRENVDKLERHEFRERQLGDNLMKSLSGMDRRLSLMDRLIREADKRTERLDTALKEIRAEIKQQNDAVLAEIQRAVQGGGIGGSTAIATTDCAKEEWLVELNTNMTQRSSDALQIILEAITNSRSAVLDNLAHTADRKQLTETIGAVHKLSSDLLQKITTTSDKTVKIVQESANKNQEVASTILTTLTGEGLIDVRSGNSDSNKSQEVLNRLDLVAKELQDLSSNVNNSQDEILKQVRNYGEVEKVLVRTADNVLDAKRTIEYSVHQIRAEVGDMVRHQSRELNSTLNTRFDDISTDIMTQQNGNAANLSTKIETEISQVWRQIGIMYQQLSTSAEMLQRLQQQTEAYVNGSLKTIGEMEGKVGQITGQMGQVDDNLQFLLGRLSLVTQEFNAVKSSVGAILDGLRTGLADVQNTIKDTGPGPNPLPPNYPTVETAN